MPLSPSGERRASGARHLPLLPEHQVIDEQPRASFEELGQRLRPVLSRQAVLLLDGDPRQLPPQLRDPRRVLLELALGREQLLARRLPLLLRPNHHRTSFALTWSSLRPGDGGKLIGSPNASNSSGRCSGASPADLATEVSGEHGPTCAWQSRGRFFVCPTARSITRLQRCLDRAVGRILLALMRERP